MIGPFVEREAADTRRQRLKRERKRRERHVIEPVLHPKEEAELRARARKNVENDLALLRDLALRRVALSNKRIKFLGECELELIDVLVARLGKVPQL